MIVGFNLNKIFVERKAPLKGQVKINTRTNISSVEKQEKSKFISKESLKFDFEFSITYEPKIAEIKIEGHITYLAEDKESKEILEAWKKKQLPDSVRILVLNHILTKCNIKALVLEEELGLPAHLPLPKFQAKQEGKEKANYTG